MQENHTAILLLICIVALFLFMIEVGTLPSHPQSDNNIEVSHSKKHEYQKIDTNTVGGPTLIQDDSIRNIYNNVPDVPETIVPSSVPDVPETIVPSSVPPNLFVLTTGERSFREPKSFKVSMIHGGSQQNVVSDTYDEGFGPGEWPFGAQKVAEGHVTVWKKIAAECSDWCYVSEDDALWPDDTLPIMPEDGFVSFFREAVCEAATRSYSADYHKVIKSIVRGRCMPYGAVAYALTKSFANTLLDALPMNKPVDHFLWEQAVKHDKAYVARDYVVKHAKGKSLRESVVQSSDESEYIDVDQNGFDDIQLKENEGSHETFDKSWSKLNKFITNKGFLKLGRDNIAHEFLYWNIVDILGVTEIMLGEPSIRFACQDASALEHQFKAKHKYILPLYGILFPYKDGVRSGWDQTEKCRNIQDPRALAILFVDYLMGHSDRPSNCHTLNGVVYAIDNDGVTLDHQLKSWNNNIQENILYEIMKKESVHSDLEHLPLDSLNSKVLHERMAIFSTCDNSLNSHLDTLIESVLWRRDQFISKKGSRMSEDDSDSHDTQEFSCDGWDDSSNIQWTKNTCTKNTFDMAVHLIPDIVSDHIKTRGCWEKKIVSDVVQELNKAPNSLFLDVGANIGAFTTTAAAEGHEVIAVEPFYLNIPVIGSTICHHKYDWVHLYKVGLSDTSPGQKMCIWSTNSQINNGNARMTPYFEGKKDFGNDKQKECMEVIQTMTLDELLFDVYRLDRPIAAMKIDIEGFETRAFRGAKRLLSSEYKPKKIWFEYQRAATVESGVSKDEIFETLTNAGYTIIDFRVSSVPLTPPSWGNIHVGDLLATLADDTAHNPKIAVAVPTYNRIGYVQLCGAALRDTFPSDDIYVFDDHSDQFSTKDLRVWFGTDNVRQNDERLKPDRQARAIVEWFIETEYDWLVTLDSDLIVRPDWLEKFKDHLTETQGMVSLYHSGNHNHPTGKCNDGLCEMKSLGNAGVAWSKSLAKRMLSAMENRDGFDWGWTNWLQKQDIPQYAFEDSLVLHVGMHGTWGVDSKREKSKGFDLKVLSNSVRAQAELYLNGLSPDSEHMLLDENVPKLTNLHKRNRSLNRFEKCSWSGRKYPFPYWDNPAFENTIRQLNEAGVVYFLRHGALIGAYRHGGPVPCDGDMDIVFPVWLNGLASCPDAETPVLRGYEKNNEGLLTLCGLTRSKYVSKTSSWLRKHIPNVRSIESRDFGGLRVDFSGIGVDWIVSILDQAYLKQGPICRCQFGSVEALCYENSLAILKSVYGEDVLTPSPKTASCMKRAKLIVQNVE